MLRCRRSLWLEPTATEIIPIFPRNQFAHAGQ